MWHIPTLRQLNRNSIIIACAVTDSGRSTLRDPIECDSDHKSLQEEFSDAESQLKSVREVASYDIWQQRIHYFSFQLESNDSNNSRARTHKSDNLCMTPISIVSCDTTGDPDRTYKVVLAGDAAVGKSCFIHRFCKGNFAHRLGSTLGTLKNHRTPYSLHDFNSKFSIPIRSRFSNKNDSSRREKYCSSIMGHRWPRAIPSHDKDIFSTRRWRSFTLRRHQWTFFSQY